MIKKVKVEELKLGMYIHDFNCGWLNHPFLSNSMPVDSDDIIKKTISYGIREVYIDTSKGHDDANAPTEEEVKKEIDAEIIRVAEQEKINRSPVTIQEEFVKAREIKQEAKKTIHNIMEDIRFGKQVRTEEAGIVVDRMIDSIFRNQDALISLGRIKDKDEYTYMHSVSVGVLMISFSKYLGFDVPLLKEVGMGALLHDIGKMIVPQTILNKEGGLTEDELAMMKKHVEYSRMLLEESSGISANAVTLAAQHHERVDGTGYPSALKDGEIAFFSRAAAIVDVYDAMTSRRCYQDKFMPTEALKKLYEWSSYHYDRNMVQRFIRCIGIYPIGTLVRLESGFIAVVLRHGEQSLLQPVVRVIYNITKGDFIRMPYDIDLSSPSGKHSGDRVVSYESPGKWDIVPEKYLGTV